MAFDEYVGMTLGQVIEILDIPDLISEKKINYDYLPTPVEPPYFIFFSENELKTGVTIKLARWIFNKGRTEILVWLKETDGEYIVFTSKRSRINNNRLKVYL